MTKATASVCVVGASGLVGRALVDQLCAAADVGAVHLMVRARSDFGTSRKLTQHVVDFDRLTEAQWPACDALFCCLGSTIKKAGSQSAFRKVDCDYVVQSAQCALQAGASSLMVVSAMGAARRSAVFYNRVKGEMEEGVAQLGFASVSIFRPSFLAGDRIEKRSGEQLALRVLQWTNPLFPKKYRSVPAHAVARAMIASLRQPPSGLAVIESDALQAYC